MSMCRYDSDYQTKRCIRSKCLNPSKFWTGHVSLDGMMISAGFCSKKCIAILDKEMFVHKLRCEGHYGKYMHWIGKETQLHGLERVDE